MDAQQLIGKTVAGKYRIARLLARGGFSYVFLATQAGVERPVALKILDLHDDIDPTWLERFAREAQLVSQLRHPNTITIFDYGQADHDFLYIAMEYIEGASLNRTIRREGPLEPLRVAHIGAAICASLDEAHGRGILHRDLKPSNVMLTADHRGEEQVKVLDFGVAKVLEATPDIDPKITLRGAFVGTPRYASPEQLRREDLDPRSDLYNLGLLLWEAIVGEPAVPSVEYGTCIEHHLASTPWRLPRWAGCPPALTAVIETLLERSPEDRYASCVQAQEALEAAIALTDGPPTQEVVGHVESYDPYDPYDPFGELAPLDDFNEVVGFDPSAPPSRPPAPRPTSARPTRPTRPSPAPPAPAPPAPAPPAPVHTAPPRPTPARPATRPPSETPMPRHTPDREPAPASSALSEFIAENRWFAAAVAGIGVVTLFLGAALYSAGEAPSTDAPAAAAPAPPEEIPEELVDTTPTLDTKVILLAIRTAGWKIGPPQATEMSDVIQTNVMASKASATANVTIYECKDQGLADELARSTVSPSESVTFGRTVVRISPGATRTKSGVPALTGALFTFKSIARDEGAIAATEDDVDE